MPSRLIFSRTCLTRSLRPAAFTCASKSVIGTPAVSHCYRHDCPAMRPLPLPANSAHADCSNRLLAPRKRTVGGWMQFAFGETREAERFQEIARPATDILGHELADADHLISVV